MIEVCVATACIPLATVTEEFPNIYVAMPIMDIIMTNMVWFTLGWIALLSFVMFRKTNIEDDATSGGIQGRFYG